MMASHTQHSYMPMALDGTLTGTTLCESILVNSQKMNNPARVQRPDFTWMLVYSAFCTTILLFGLFADNIDYLQDAGVPFYSETHGGEDVAVYASGPMSYLLTGTYEQSYIPHAMMYAACIGSNTDNCADTSSGIKQQLSVSLVIAAFVFTLLMERTIRVWNRSWDRPSTWTDSIKDWIPLETMRFFFIHIPVI